MKRFIVLLAALVITNFAVSQETPYLDGEILIKLEKSTDIQDWIIKARLETNTPSLKAEDCLNRHLAYWKLSFDHNAVNDVDLKSKLAQDEDVLIVQFNHIVSNREIPDDPLFGEQWHHFEEEDHDIDTDLAWDITTGGLTPLGDEIVACVIEGGGASWDHEDLLANHWTNEGEIEGDGIDNDDNGYVDDYHGWDPTSDDDNINGGNHGTQVSSMIGSVGDDGVGVTGVNWNVKIMQVMVGGLSEGNVIAAYEYPMTMRMIYNETGGAEGAFVVVTNASWGIDGGDPENSPLWCDYYDTLGEIGILNCGATANNNVDIDVVGDLPTGCDSDYMISVTATNDNDVRTFSGYGEVSIDLGAPGEDVYLARNTNAYGSTSGTSFASPCVAGAIALMYSAPCPSFAAIAQADPQVGADQIRQYLFDGVDLVDNLSDECFTGGRLNVNNSIELMLSTCTDGGCLIPFAVNFEAAEGGDFFLNWGSIEGMDSFDVRYRMVGSDTWTEMNDLTGNSLSFTELDWCTEYEFQLASNCTEEDSEWSTSYMYTTDGCCVAPANDTFIVEEITTSSISLSWEFVLAAENYFMEYREVGSPEWILYGETEATSQTYSELNECTEYEFRMYIECASGEEPTYTDVFEISTYGCGDCTDLTYCEALGESTSDEWLESIEIGSFVNESGDNDGYIDFGDLGWILLSGEELPVTLTPGYSGTTYAEYFKIFLDINGDGEFDESGDELVFDPGEPVNEPVSGTLFIPDGVIGEGMKMRVIMMYSFGGAEPDPCDQFTYGEVEDYCVNVVASDNITGIAVSESPLVYPNPIKDQMTIQMESQNILSIDIYNAASALVLSQQVNKNTEVLNMDFLSSGFYTYRIILENGQGHQGKFIKK